MNLQSKACVFFLSNICKLLFPVKIGVNCSKILQTCVPRIPGYTESVFRGFVSDRKRGILGDFGVVLVVCHYDFQLVFTLGRDGVD